MDLYGTHHLTDLFCEVKPGIIGTNNDIFSSILAKLKENLLTFK
jgi:hypothetical protein